MPPRRARNTCVARWGQGCAIPALPLHSHAVLHFKVGPFPVSVYPWFFISAVLLGGRGLGFGWGMLAWIFIVFVGVLGHELGHALVGRVLGGHPEIRLEAFGGVTFPQLPKRPTPARQFLLSVGGPLAGLLLAAIASGVLRLFPPAAGSPAGWGMEVFIRVSVLWAEFNLLPILPLDGGQMMLAVLEGVRKRPSVTLASWLSFVATIAVAALYVTFYGLDPLMLVFLGLFALQNFQRARSAGRAPVAAAAPPGETATERADVAAATAETRSALEPRPRAGGGATPPRRARPRPGGRRRGHRRDPQRPGAPGFRRGAGSRGSPRGSGRSLPAGHRTAPARRYRALPRRQRIGGNLCRTKLLHLAKRRRGGGGGAGQPARGRRGPRPQLAAPCRRGGCAPFGGAQRSRAGCHRVRYARP